MITFNVDKVQKANKPLSAPFDWNFGKNKPTSEQRLALITEQVKKQFDPRGLVESTSPIDLNLHANGGNNFISMLNVAYNTHIPIAISPDDIWLIISQSVAKYIELNAEQVRHHFVSHKGKETLTVSIDDFTKGTQNPWERVFPQFSDKIADYIGPKRDLMVANFSTTTPLQKSISEIVLMDSMKSYFEYRCVTACGYPEITLTGSKDDWVNIKNRVSSLSFLPRLVPWIDRLYEHLDHFISAFDDVVRKDFWSDLFKQHSMGSGTPIISGWIRDFFLFDKNDKENQLNDSNFLSDSANFPSGLSFVPFVWDYLGTEFSMFFGGGIVGYTQNKDSLIISPNYGWSVWEVVQLEKRHIELEEEYYDKKGTWELREELEKNFSCKILDAFNGTIEMEFPKNKLEEIKQWKEEMVSKKILKK